MSEQKKISTIKTHFAGWNNKNIDLITVDLADDFVLESDTIPAPIAGILGMREYARVYFAAFPDLRFQITDIFAAEDRVTACWTATGTQRGPFLGMPPSERTATVHGCNVVQFRRGEVIRITSYWDRETLARHLGAVSGEQLQGQTVRG